MRGEEEHTNEHQRAHAQRAAQEHAIGLAHEILGEREDFEGHSEYEAEYLVGGNADAAENDGEQEEDGNQYGRDGLNE